MNVQRVENMMIIIDFVFSSAVANRAAGEMVSGVFVPVCNIVHSKYDMISSCFRLKRPFQLKL